MNPFFFGPSNEQLYGAYYPPATAFARDKGVVICQPIWQEYIRAHWACTQLAHGLNKQGIHVLLFDYFGAGDSAGASEEGSVGHWIEDAACAVQELRDIAGIKKIGLIGIRFGAAIACKVGAEKKPAPFAIGYWDPVLAGVAYMSDMQSLQERLEAADDYINFTTSPSKALMGFPFSEVQRKSIATMDISDSFSGQQTPYFVVHSEDTPRTREYIDKCKSGPFFRGACHVPHESDWLAIQTYDNIIMSPTIMDKLIAFMAQQEQ